MEHDVMAQDCYPYPLLGEGKDIGAWGYPRLLWDVASKNTGWGVGMNDPFWRTKKVKSNKITRDYKMGG